jgi:hypothetical protein
VNHAWDYLSSRLTHPLDNSPRTYFHLITLPVKFLKVIFNKAVVKETIAVVVLEHETASIRSNIKYVFNSLQHSPSQEANSSEATAFYGTRRFITAFTRARHLSLSWARSIKYKKPPPPFYVSKIHFNIILSSTLVFSKWSSSPRFPHQSPARTSHLPPYTYYVPCLSHSSWYNHSNISGEKYRAQSCSLCSLLQSLLDPNIFLSTIFSKTLSAQD